MSFYTFIKFVVQHPSCDVTGAKNKDKHRRKAKVVAAAWGTKFIQFLAALAFCLEEQDEFILCFKSSWCN